mmetsp:Transcript_7403/g.16181  ORF Transcript_7403/g.16181 Transcript_7403/m.16181 type:complete len:120 (-) Transcript_7403:48-407(-)
MLSSNTNNNGSDYMYLTHPTSTGRTATSVYVSPDNTCNDDKENVSPTRINVRAKQALQQRNRTSTGSNDRTPSSRRQQGQRRVLGERLDSAFQAVSMRFSERDLATELAAEYSSTLSFR